MEDLLSNNSNDMPGLNIIFQNDDNNSNGTANNTILAKTIISQKMRKPKKSNKYEKRRAKAQKAKQMKEKKKGQGIIQNRNGNANGNDNDPISTGTKHRGPLSSSANKSNEADRSNTVNNESHGNNECKSQEKSRDNGKDTMSNTTANASSPFPSSSDQNEDQGSEKSNTRQITSSDNSNSHSDITLPISMSTTDQSSITSSRKNQHFRTEQMLKDEVKRAEYMSTYHARPFEMDRKSGATWKIQESKESNHIFGNDNDDYDNDDMDSTGTGAGARTGGENASNAENGVDCPFACCGLHPNIIRTITSSRGTGLNLKRPTLIQRNAWKHMLVKKGEYGKKLKQRKNIFVQSETGSGKTLAYLLPIVQHLAIDSKTFQMKKVDRKLGGTRAIILCPTRELASQTAIISEKICLNSFPWLVAGCLSGGEKRKSEKARLRKGISILIATPGRLLDHLEKTDSLLMALKGNLEWVVLDESDRLLDMGLGSQVEQIMQMVRANQPKSGINRDGITWQSALVSATINEKVEKMSSALLGGDTWVWARASKSSKNIVNNIKEESNFTSVLNKDSMPTNKLELSSATPQQLTQHHMVVSSKLRLTALISFLTTRVQKNERIIVFMSTCDGVDFHFKLFSQMQSIIPWEKGSEELNEVKAKPGIFGSSCSLYRLHGNIQHKERHEIMSQFCNVDDLKKRGSVLITTDVAARGLNLPSVDWIVQYDPPCETADYIHRAGRAARAGKAGHALLFLLPSEMQYIEVLNIRGLTKLTALSLSSTLQSAAKICPETTSEGLDRSSTSKSNSSRLGEAFMCAVQQRLEDCIINDDKQYKDSLSKKVLPDGGDKEQRRKKRREAKNAVGPLLESARLAFAAYIRGYSTKEKLVRHIFSARALHLGHVAKSFALKEQPKELSKAQRSKRISAKIIGTNEESLKTTGRKRSLQLAFGKSGDEKKNRKENFVGELENKSGSLPDNTEIFDSNRRHRNIGNIKASMFAMASKMEEGDMEFF